MGFQTAPDDARRPAHSGFQTTIPHILPQISDTFTPLICHPRSCGCLGAAPRHSWGMTPGRITEKSPKVSEQGVLVHCSLRGGERIRGAQKISLEEGKPYPVTTEVVQSAEIRQRWFPCALPRIRRLYWVSLARHICSMVISSGCEGFLESPRCQRPLHSHTFFAFL